MFSLKNSDKYKYDISLNYEGFLKLLNLFLNSNIKTYLKSN